MKRCAVRGRNLSDSSLQIDALDGLRGFAVLIVILAHTGNAGFHLIPFLDLSGAGHAGVYLFFELSAFLLTYLFIAHGSNAFTLDRIAIYFQRRFFRIYPLYFLYLTAALISTWLVSIYRPDLSIGIPMSLTLGEYATQLLMIEGKGITWSIPVEFHFYFMLPLVAYGIVVLCGNRVRPAVLFIACLLGLAALLWPIEKAESIRSVVYHLPVFLFGTTLALLHQHWITSGRNRNQKSALVIEILGLLSLLAILLLTPSMLRSLGFSSFAFKPHRQFLLFAMLWGTVIFAAIHGNGLIGQVFRIKWLRYLGFISFSAYLLHPVFISGIVKSGLKEFLHPFASGWLVLTLTAAVSWVTFSLIEKPMSRYSLKPTIAWRAIWNRTEP